MPGSRPAGSRAWTSAASSIGLTPRATRTRLAKLIDRGLVRDVGTSPRDPKRRYFPVGYGMFDQQNLILQAITEGKFGEPRTTTTL